MYITKANQTDTSIKMHYFSLVSGVFKSFQYSVTGHYFVN